MSLEKARTGKPSRYLNDEGRLDFKMRQYVGLTPLPWIRESRQGI
jgi:hypothetical protein